MKLPLLPFEISRRQLQDMFVAVLVFLIFVGIAFVFPGPPEPEPVPQVAELLPLDARIDRTVIMEAVEIIRMLNRPIDPIQVPGEEVMGRFNPFLPPEAGPAFSPPELPAEPGTEE